MISNSEECQENDFKDVLLGQGLATFYRQRAIWTRLPQQGDR